MIDVRIKGNKATKLFSIGSSKCRPAFRSIFGLSTINQTHAHTCSGQDLIVAHAGMPASSSTSPTQLPPPLPFTGTLHCSAGTGFGTTATGTGSGCCCGAGACFRAAAVAGRLQAGAAGCCRPRMAAWPSGTRGTMGRLSQVQTSTMKPSGSWKKSWST